MTEIEEKFTEAVQPPQPVTGEEANAVSASGETSGSAGTSDAAKAKDQTWSSRIRKNLSGLFHRSPYALDEQTDTTQQPVSGIVKAAEATSPAGSHAYKHLSKDLHQTPYALTEEEQAAAQPDRFGVADAPAENPFVLSEAEQAEAAAAQANKATADEPKNDMYPVELPMDRELAEEAARAEAEARTPPKRHKRHWYGVPVGTLVICLALVGFGWLCVQGFQYVYGRITDDSKERAFDRYLNTVVMLDPEPFESLSAADKTMIQQAAVWKTVFDNIADLSNYDDQARLVIPGDLVRENAVKLFGVNCILSSGNFTMGNSADGSTTVTYDELSDAYHVPLLETVGTYQPYTVSARKQGSATLLKVAYCITVDASASSLEAEIVGNNLAVVKYMEYEIAYDGDTQMNYISAIRELEN